MTYRVNTGKFKRVNRRVMRYLEKELPGDTLDKMKENTPKDKGHARRNTKLRKNYKGFKIEADYPYSGVIDKGGYPNPPKAGTGKTRNGYSTQAPEGIIKPTIDWIQQTLRKKIKGFSRIRGVR